MNIGDYIRTKDGIIAKIIELEENPYGEKTIYILDKEINVADLEMGEFYLTVNPLAEEKTNKIDIHFGDEQIIKLSSPQIIDLIEKGDYINGSWVNKIKDNKPYHEDYNDPYYSYYFENDDIKTIVTHEQMEAMQYRVEE